MQPITVVKVGGNELDDPAFLEGLCAVLANAGCPLVLAHGGGKEITAALERYGQASTFVEGLRVTPPESMAVMEMVVCGTINKRIVARLIGVGVKALGISGVDLGLLRCEPQRPNGRDIGRVGLITSVDTDTLTTFVRHRWLPVIAPVALGSADGLPYNVNADQVAQSIAAALGGNTEQGVEELVFISNVPGVIIGGSVVQELTAPQIEAAIGDGSITGGMIPKVRAALAALAAGVRATRITNLAGFAHGGTRIVAGV